MIEGIVPSQPTSVWHRNVKVNVRELFLSLGKGLIAGNLGNWVDAAKEVVDAIGSVSLDSDPAGATSILLQKAATKALFELASEHSETIARSDYDLNLLQHTITGILETAEIVVDEELFQNPRENPLIRELVGAFRAWLTTAGVPIPQASSTSNRLPSYFVYALNLEWFSNPQQYNCILEAVSTPFYQASERERAWNKYNAWLQKQVEYPMFNESFGINQVYVPLRAFYTTRTKISGRPFHEPSAPQTESRYVVDLQDSIIDWINASKREDAIRVLSGGPGSGKSTFAKMLAARLANEGKYRTLFVPLHRLELREDLIEAIGQFIAYDRFLPYNPLSPKEGEERLLIIFDGLDELSMQGQVGPDVANTFLRSVDKLLLHSNGTSLRLQVIVVGRELSVQSNSSEFRKIGQILHLLPYYVDTLADDWEEIVDPDNLISIDQRDDWWAKYGKVTGQDFTKMPEKLHRPDLEEVTSQPLLNYLVALGYARKRISFEGKFNLNAMYQDLLTSVYERGWTGHQHISINDLSFSDFVRVLEEVALASFHGDGRTTTVKDIAKRCSQGGLEQKLTAFQAGAKEGVTRLLTAFYFRQVGIQSDGEHTFEFTHKSFGEFLTAKRFVRAVEKINKMRQRRMNDPDDGWGEKECLIELCSIVGPNKIDNYFAQFLRREIALYKASTVKKWQNDLSIILGYLLKSGLPLERTPERPSFSQEQQVAKNVTNCLITLLGCCSRVTKLMSTLENPREEAFGEWLSFVQGQRRGPSNPVCFDELHHLDLSMSMLDMRDLYEANLSFSNLDDSAINYAILWSANLRNATLNGAVLLGTILDWADLRGVEAQQSILKYAYLRSTDLREANFSDADFREANLYGADLEGANFSRADLRGADLTNANLIGASFNEAKMTGAKVPRDQWLSGEIVALPKDEVILVDWVDDKKETRHSKPKR